MTPPPGLQDLPLFPRPREVTTGDGTGAPIEIDTTPDAALPAQGYELAIGSDGTRVRHADDLGLRYARQTIAALADADAVPTGRIRDWPDFTHRGFMLDVSRDRVPTMATLEWLITRLADLRYNHLELYTEHTFAYADHEVVWRNASPITAEELRRLDAVCHDHGIELAANQNTFGHMDRWLRHAAYQTRAECPHGSEHLGIRLPPWSLEPTSANAAFALGLVREMADNLRSRRVNIGADEPFDLGLGRTASRVAEEGRAVVFLEHLRRLVDPLVADGHDVLFWGDGLVRHPELVHRLPPAGATAVVWNYEAPRPEGPSLDALVGPELAELLGLPPAANHGFVSYVAAYAEAGYPMWVAPGTSSWASLLGRWTNARGNLDDAARVGLDVGAPGFLVTNWGDHGHPEPLPVSLLGATYGAGVAWCRAANHDVDVVGVVDRLLEARPGVGARLAELGDLYRGLGVSAVNGSPLLLVMIDATTTWPLSGRLDPAGADTAETLLVEATEHFTSVPFSGSRRRAVADELVAACRLARHGLWRLRDQHGDGPVDRRVLVDDFAAAVALQRDAWLATSRPGGLDDSITRLVAP